MANNVTDYNAREVDLIIGTIVIDSGLADGDFVRVAPVSDDYSDKAGVDGDVARSKTNDERADVSIILMQTSPGHRALMAMRQAGLLLKNGGGIVPFLLKDKGGAVLTAGENCWIVRAPDQAYSGEQQTREWKLRIAHAKITPDPTKGVVNLVPGL